MTQSFEEKSHIANILTGYAMEFSRILREGRLDKHEVMYCHAMCREILDYICGMFGSNKSVNKYQDGNKKFNDLLNLVETSGFDEDDYLFLEISKVRSADVKAIRDKLSDSQAQTRYFSALMDYDDSSLLFDEVIDPKARTEQAVKLIDSAESLYISDIFDNSSSEAPEELRARRLIDPNYNELDERLKKSKGYNAIYNQAFDILQDVLLKMPDYLPAKTALIDLCNKLGDSESAIFLATDSNRQPPKDGLSLVHDLARSTTGVSDQSVNVTQEQKDHYVQTVAQAFGLGRINYS